MMIKLLILCVLVLISSCAPVITESVRQSREEQESFKDRTDGVKEPTYPPYCWLSPPGSELWYPCGQRPESELGKHGH